ncbi:MAG: TetR family transcriptional regulator [Micavibrio aeruginosavorus]|uniref:TetR family transcriptional regulator n=1 Tax=Micavibrio aeruginosavorus TaxID=349221 RepID=A0A2W5HKD0_9BACT|nr:MAG: TetR family transcriptional regulator [Micavibrio aeruginosavorus]
MRVKTEEKRQKIIEIASTLFLEKGFDKLSMSDIATKVGGSKATLYGYFHNKEELFVAVMMANARSLAAKAFAALEAKLPLEKKLDLFDREYLAFILSQDMIDMKRRVIAQADKIEIGAHIYECGIKTSWGRVAALLDQGVRDKKVRKCDTWLAAMQLKSLLEADLYTKRLMGVEKRLNKKLLPDAVKNALKVFWAYYKN